ncbi:MAG TPA: hypothetical protein VFV87_22905 [Pirellulaceae bacterium]|nr:hypothetical protein [Pirellulaceae bacterium]
MKHATDDSLDRLEPLLAQVRQIAGLVERKRGVWYRKSQAFLHFHEDPAGLFADLKVGRAFERLPVDTARQRQALLRRIKQVLAD